VVVTETPTITLNNGAEMPILGFGVFQIPPDETEQAVATALEVGYRSIDTASAYQNEEPVGRAIRDSGIPRAELYITTNLFIQDPGEDRARAAFERSLERLGLDHVDLPNPSAPWRLLQLLAGDGTVIRRRAHPSDRRLELLSRPACRPDRAQPGHPGSQPDRSPPILPAAHTDHEVMHDHGVQMEAWGGFAEGRNNLFSDPTLSAIGEAPDKSIAQLVLRWLIQREIVVIPKSVRRDRMEENLEVFDFALTDEEIARITAMDTGETLFFDHRDPAMVSWLNGRRET
jgi:2,5-diketo-D-gluconate reductase A